MVDRDARNEAAKLIRLYFSGKITEWDFGELYPDSNEDPAIYQVWRKCYHLLWDIDDDKLRDKKLRKEVARWLLYLKNAFEYNYPLKTIFDSPGQSDVFIILVISFAGMWMVFSSLIQIISGICFFVTILIEIFRVFKESQKKERLGNNVWPFCCTEQFEVARSRPFYLTGNEKLRTWETTT